MRSCVTAISERKEEMATTSLLEFAIIAKINTFIKKI